MRVFYVVLVGMFIIGCGVPPTPTVKPVPTLTAPTMTIVVASSTRTPTATATRVSTPATITPTARPLPPTYTPAPPKTSTPRPPSPTPTITPVPKEVIIVVGQTYLFVSPRTGQSERITLLGYQEGGYTIPGYLPSTMPAPFFYRETTNLSGEDRTFHLYGSCDRTFFQPPQCGFLMRAVWEGKEWYGFYMVHDKNAVVTILYPYKWEAISEPEE